MQRVRELARVAGSALPAWRLGLGSFLLCWVMFLVYYHLKFHINIPPAVSGDEVDYDALGWELAHGRGFTVDTGNPEFRRPYEMAAKSAERFELGPPRQAVIASRPPLYPLAISVLNRLFGRQFWAVRLMDAALMAGTLALIAMILDRRFGGRAVLILLVLFIAVDVRTRLYGRAILTEAMSAFLTSLVILGLMSLQEMRESRRRRVLLWSGVIGVLFGLSLLARTLMVLWVPGLCLIVFWLVRRLGHGFWSGIGGAAGFLLGAGLIVSPWAVRNLQVTGEFMPLGTQGLTQMSAAFGDAVWNTRGVWTNLDPQGFFEEVKTPSQTPLEREIAKAKYSRAKAVEWIRANPGKAVVLFPLKIWQEIRPRSVMELVLFVLTAIGMAVYGRTELGQLLLAVFATNLFAIGITWSVEGRFLVPVLLPIHVFAAVGALWLWAKLTKSRFEENPHAQIQPAGSV
jgi:4-amino-4-deoxy-L-arabinose transferase-like glycosyltransferase